MRRFENDSVTRTVGLLSDRWTFLILREAFHGVRRFGEMARDLGVSRTILSRQLRTLVEHGVLERRQYRSAPDRFEYVLSDAGRELYPAVVALMQWGDRHMTGPEGPPLALRHKLCGELTSPVLVCSCCGEPVDARDIEVEPGPGAGAAGTGAAEHATGSRDAAGRGTGRS
ncbi:MAG: helix-turn-helix domain-containing protein [Solirubrobacteraceae bacterium]|jgi:DNA-binding HxlR family transcriptional regulator